MFDKLFILLQDKNYTTQKVMKCNDYLDETEVMIRHLFKKFI